MVITKYIELRGKKKREEKERTEGKKSTQNQGRPGLGWLGLTHLSFLLGRAVLLLAPDGS